MKGKNEQHQTLEKRWGLGISSAWLVRVQLQTTSGENNLALSCKAQQIPLQAKIKRNLGVCSKRQGTFKAALS